MNIFGLQHGPVNLAYFMNQQYVYLNSNMNQWNLAYFVNQWLYLAVGFGFLYESVNIFWPSAWASEQFWPLPASITELWLSVLATCMECARGHSHPQLCPVCSKRGTVGCTTALVCSARVAVEHLQQMCAEGKSIVSSSTSSSQLPPSWLRWQLRYIYYSKL